MAQKAFHDLTPWFPQGNSCCGPTQTLHQATSLSSNISAPFICIGMKHLPSRLTPVHLANFYSFIKTQLKHCLLKGAILDCPFPTFSSDRLLPSVLIFSQIYRMTLSLVCPLMPRLDAEGAPISSSYLYLYSQHFEHYLTQDRCSLYGGRMKGEKKEWVNERMCTSHKQ